MKILTTIICAILFRFGGWRYKFCRRIILPIILSLYLAIVFKTWWLFIAVGLGLQTIGIGYGVPDPPTFLNPDKGSWLGRLALKLCHNNYEMAGWVARGAYGAVVALAGTLGLILGQFWGISLYLGYILGNFVLGAVLSYFKVPNPWIELLIGAGIGSVVLFR